MKAYKIYIESILASDQKSLTKMQAKINQWITTGLLKKYEIHTTSEFVVFNLCLNSSAQ